MPQLMSNTAVPANGTLNPFAGTMYEYLSFPANVRIGMLAAAAGIVVTITSGSDTLAEEGPVPIGATATSFPKDPDDFHWVDEAAPGDKLAVKLRNTTGGGVVVNFIAKIDPLVA